MDVYDIYYEHISIHTKRLIFHYDTTKVLKMLLHIFVAAYFNNTTVQHYHDTDPFKLL